MIFISEIIEIHNMILEDFGGPSGIRDNNLLESSLNGIYSTFSGIDLYPTKVDKIVRLGFNIIKNHPFVDGNKRVGCYLVLYLLDKNGYEYDAIDFDKVILEVASENMDYNKFVESVKNIIK